MHQADALVLVVEDEPILRMVASDILADEGYRTLEAEDASEALRILADRGDVTVLFTDIDMPGGRDGVELAHEVCRRWPRIEIIVTSGVARPETSSLPGHGSFLPKPYRVHDLVELVAGKLARGSGQDGQAGV